MLYGYPLSATRHNWLHDCLVAILQDVHADLNAGRPPKTWPDLIPSPHREDLKSRTGLRDRLDTYIQAASSLSRAERDKVLKALSEQNDISSLVSCACDCASVEELPAAIQAPATDLFTFAFKLLTDLEIRDRHYEEIHSAMRSRVCPFCGMERFDPPEAPREDLDHYLVRTKYPLAAANLRNLVPMGDKCNVTYKKAQDMLRKTDGTRRKSFYPYNAGRISVFLSNSEPFGGSRENLPKWKVEFSQRTEEVETWNEVFRITERYEKYTLNEEYYRWLDEFSAWCRRQKVPPTPDDVLSAVEQYANYQEDCELGDMAFLKAAVFHMIHKHCQVGNERLLTIFRNLVASATQQKLILAAESAS